MGGGEQANTTTPQELATVAFSTLTHVAGSGHPVQSISKLIFCHKPLLPNIHYALWINISK